MKTLKQIENDLLQAVKSLTAMRTTPGHTANNVRAVASMVADVGYELNRYAGDMGERDYYPDPIADSRPERCTFRLRAQGNPYPRSGCWVEDCHRKREDSYLGCKSRSVDDTP